MKKIYLWILSVVAIFVSGCGDFLDMKPKDMKVVSTIEDYRDILADYMRALRLGGDDCKVFGEWYMWPQFNVSEHCAFRSGELSYNQYSTIYYDGNTGKYTDHAVRNLIWQGTGDGIWNSYYKFLGPINLIIGGIGTAEGDDERLRDYVKGEALVWRAFSYFKLLQYFSPYKNNEYGIPVYLKPYEDAGNAMPPREKQTDVYRQILGDCEEVLALLERTPSTGWNYAYNYRFVYGMMTSIYSYKAMSAAAEEDDWDNAVKYADLALEGRKFTRDEEAYRAMFNAWESNLEPNDEFYFRLASVGGELPGNMGGIYCNKPDNSSYVAAKLSDPAWYARYREDDVRKDVFFEAPCLHNKYNCQPNGFFDEWLGYVRGGTVLLYRTAETQLNKAEALYRMGKTVEAKEALNTFKQGRYQDVTGSYTESEILDEILKERKLEFYHEQDMWWLDQKRTGTRQERVVNGVRYVLEPDDCRYSFPIPTSELEVNKNMVQTPGWDQIIH